VVSFFLSSSSSSLRPPCITGCGHIYSHPVVSSFFISSPNLSGWTLDVYHTSTHGANLECKSEMCCKLLAENTARKNDAKTRHLGTIAQLCQAISSQLRHIQTIGKKLLNSNISPTCPYNMVNFGSLAAEIVSLFWGTPATFDSFRVLAALLHGTPPVGVSQTLRC